MAILIAPILFVAAVLYVAYPLLADGRGEQSPDDSPDAFDDLLAEKDDLLSSLKDVEMDYRMGKLSLQDYNVMRVDFERRIARTLKRLDEMDPVGDKET